VAFIFAPPALVPRIGAAIRGTTWMAAPLMAEIAAMWIRDGTAEALLKRRRREAAARHRLALRVLAGSEFQSHPSAYHLWLHLPPAWRSEPFAEAARTRGVAVMPATAFAVGRGGPEAVRISLGAARGRPELERGLSVLASLLEAVPERAALPAGP
jgi:DNA-binding transcriptional MocR family regulator